MPSLATGIQIVFLEFLFIETYFCMDERGKLIVASVEFAYASKHMYTCLWRPEVDIKMSSSASQLFLEKRPLVEPGLALLVSQ